MMLLKNRRRCAAISRKHKTLISTDFSVSCSVSKGYVMKDFHSHDCFEIYYAMTDGIKYFVDDRIYDIHKGEIFVFNNMELHKTLVPGNMLYERCIVLFNPEYIRSLSNRDTDLLECFVRRGQAFSHVVRLSQNQIEVFESLLEKGRYYCDNSVYGQEVYKKIVLCEILLFVNRLYRTVGMTKPSRSDDNYTRIQPVIEYIHENLNGNLSLDSLSAMFFISKYHLGYLFKKVTGFTVNEYIIKCRVMKARELLRENLSVSQTCEMVGYGNVSHFIRTFREHTGLPPGRYKKQVKSYIQ